MLGRLIGTYRAFHVVILGRHGGLISIPLLYLDGCPLDAAAGRTVGCSTAGVTRDRPGGISGRDGDFARAPLAAYRLRISLGHERLNVLNPSHSAIPTEKL